MDKTVGSFETARQQAMLTIDDLWIRYMALGGYATGSELRGFLAGTSQPGHQDHDLLAHALNERFREMDLDSPVPYSHP